MKNIIINAFGFGVIGAGMAFGGIYFYQWQYWVVLIGASVVYFNASSN